MKNILAERIKKLREEKGLTQVQLAADLDLGSGFVGNIEAGKKVVSLRNLMLIADYFETTPDFLLGYKDDK